MKKYIKKPTIVEAIQLKERNILEVYTEMFGKPDLSSRIASDKWDEYEEIVKRDGIKIKTPESDGETQIAKINDYIVFGYSPELGRHFWPVKPDYFKLNYKRYKNG